MDKLGLIVALPSEARCYAKQKLPKNVIVDLNSIQLLISGMGEQRAQDAAQRLIRSNIQGLISWGTAGALSDELSAGQLILPETILLEDGTVLSTHNEWRESLIHKLQSCLQVHTDPLFHSSTIITSPQEKAELAHSTKAIAVDMESGAIAKMADQHNLPMLAIRSIVDTAKETIPFTASHSINEYGETKSRKLLVNLLSHPKDLPNLIKLGQHFKQARKTLQQVRNIAGETLSVSSRL